MGTKVGTEKAEISARRLSSVRQRVHEIGIRMALGAAGRQVFRWAIWHGLRPALVGLAAGILAAAALSRLLRGILLLVFASVTT